MPEKIHSRFCKFILGVGKYTSNIASKAELGRYPLIIFALLQSVKYWLHLNKNPFDNYRKYSYATQIHIDGSAESTFSHHISCLLKYFGFTHVWDNKTTLSVPRLMHAVKKTMFSRYEQFFYAFIQGSFLKENCTNKLRTYCTFKKTYNFENYLGVSVEKKIVSQYSRFRLSNHRLNIEVARYSRTPVTQRTCNICSSSEIEDEFHFLCICSKYANLRNIFLEDIGKFIVDFDTLSLHERFVMLLSSQQSDVNLLVVNYVNKCFELRAMHQE